MTTIELPFPLGTWVWAISPESRREKVTCPDCAGKRVLTLTLGNGDEHVMQCENCRSGYDNATGYINVYVFEHRPEKFQCEALYSVDHEGRTRYQYLGRVMDSTDLYVDYDVCAEACRLKNIILHAEQDSRHLAILESKRKSLAFSVSYWRKKVKDLERDLERARQRLNECKPKVSDG